MSADSSSGNVNDFLNSLVQKGTTTELYQTYYDALAKGDTEAQAEAAVQSYITNAGYPDVTTGQVSNSIATVIGGNYSAVESGSASSPEYPPYGSQPSILYGTYQTFATRIHYPCHDI